jgi:hypothetical protein
LYHQKKGLTSTVSSITIVLVIIVVIAVGMFALIYWYFPSTNTVGSGNLVSEEKDLIDFSKIDVEDGFEVDITHSSSYKITITADDNVIDDVQVSKSGDTLNIGLKPGIYETLNLHAEIMMPDLDELKFSGGTRGTAQGFSSTQDFEIYLSGGSRIDLDGNAENLTVDASGGSNLELSDFQINNAIISLSGGSFGTINLDGTLDADLSGGSILKYIGNPTLGDIQTSGGSVVSKE